MSISSENFECMICLEEPRGIMANLSCGHTYHYKCVKEWINKKKNIRRCCCVCDFDTEIVSLVGEDDEILPSPKRYQESILSFICCSIL